MLRSLLKMLTLIYLKSKLLMRFKPNAGALDAHVGVPAVGAHSPQMGINFGINSPKATSMDLLVYDTPDAKEPSQVLPMFKTGDIWHRAEQLPEFTAYHIPR